MPRFEDARFLNVVILVIFLAVVTRMLRRRTVERTLHLISDHDGNESLVLDATIAGRRTLFMVDTAYAGAPVVSESFSAVQKHCQWGGVSERYKKCMQLVQRTVDRDKRNVAIYNEFLNSYGCRAFTSGCTMRLMGIGETVENQADMLLCPPIVLDGRSEAHDSIRADVLVSNPLPGSVNILTIDYLLHRSPCVILPAHRMLMLRVPVSQSALLRPSFQFHDVRIVGGAYSIVFEIGGGTFNMVIDTGAATTISLSSSAIQKMRTCTHDPTKPRSVVQVGVNGERICSDVISTTVRLGKIDFGVVDVLANTSPVQGSDGYVGMGLLRALDLWFDTTRMGTRRSGLPIRQLSSTRAQQCPNTDYSNCKSGSSMA